MIPSPEERGLLAAIAAAPDDDTPRLVYADWLDEHGHPDRAEFIRISIRWDRLGFEEREDALSAPIRQRIERLKEQHTEAWTGMPAAATAVRGVELLFRRGFLSEVWCSLKWFVENAAPLTELLPTPEFLLDRVTARNVHRLRTAAHFEQVRSLAFHRGQMTEEVTAVLLNAVPLAHVRRLWIDQPGIDLTTNVWHDRFADQACRIARAPDFAELEELSLRGCGVGDRGGIAIAESRYLRALKRLDLRWNPMSAAVVKQLRDRFGVNLVYG